jgi:hypothetical protein
LAKGHHDIALVDELGRLVAKKPISETVDGFAELTAMLARAHQTPPGAPTMASNELRSLLREYYPSFLGAFAGKNGKHASNRPRSKPARCWRSRRHPSWPRICRRPESRRRCGGRRADVS